MSAMIGIDEAQAKLKELIHQLSPGEEIIITENEQPMAKLVRPDSAPSSGVRPPIGWAKDMISFVAPDFDAPLEELKEYME